MKHPAGWIVVTRRHPGSASVCAAVACGGVICGCRANLLGLPPGRTLRLKAWKPAGFHEFEGDHKMARTINCSECGKYLGNLATGSRGEERDNVSLQWLPASKDTAENKRIRRECSRFFEGIWGEAMITFDNGRFDAHRVLQGKTQSLG